VVGWTGPLPGARAVPTAKHHNKRLTDLVRSHDDGYEVRQICAGGSQSAVVTKEDEMYLWGCSEFGQTGIGIGEPDVAEPKRLVIPVKVRCVALGLEHCLALMENRTLWAWGRGHVGQLGLGNDHDQPRPVEVHHIPACVVSIATGEDHSAAVVESGELFAWGNGESGKLGFGTTMTTGMQMLPRLVRMKQVIKSVACGSQHTAAINVDDHVLTWGTGWFGRLGHGDDANRYAPKRVDHLADQGIRVRDVQLGGYHSCFLTAEDDLYMCGRDRICRDSQHLLSPVRWDQVEGDVGIDAKVAKVATAGQHMFVLTTDGQLLAWGDNRKGQLGLGRVTDFVYGVERVYFDEFPGVAVEKICTGPTHTLAYMQNRKLLSWGSETSGRLGIAVFRNEKLSLFPTQVQSPWVETNMYDHTYAEDNARHQAIEDDGDMHGADKLLAAALEHEVGSDGIESTVSSVPDVGSFGHFEVVQRLLETEVHDQREEKLAEQEAKLSDMYKEFRDDILAMHQKEADIRMFEDEFEQVFCENLKALNITDTPSLERLKIHPDIALRLSEFEILFWALQTQPAYMARLCRATDRGMEKRDSEMVYRVILELFGSLHSRRILNLYKALLRYLLVLEVQGDEALPALYREHGPGFISPMVKKPIQLLNFDKSPVVPLMMEFFRRPLANSRERPEETSPRTPDRLHLVGSVLDLRDKNSVASIVRAFIRKPTCLNQRVTEKPEWELGMQRLVERCKDELALMPEEADELKPKLAEMGAFIVFSKADLASFLTDEETRPFADTAVPPCDSLFQLYLNEIFPVSGPSPLFGDGPVNSNPLKTLCSFFAYQLTFPQELLSVWSFAQQLVRDTYGDDASVLGAFVDIYLLGHLVPLLKDPLRHAPASYGLTEDTEEGSQLLFNLGQLAVFFEKVARRQDQINEQYTKAAARVREALLKLVNASLFGGEVASGRVLRGVVDTTEVDLTVDLYLSHYDTRQPPTVTLKTSDMLRLVNLMIKKKQVVMLASEEVDFVEGVIHSLIPPLTAPKQEPGFQDFMLAIAESDAELLHNFRLDHRGLFYTERLKWRFPQDGEFVFCRATLVACPRLLCFQQQRQNKAPVRYIRVFRPDRGKVLKVLGESNENNEVCPFMDLEQLLRKLSAHKIVTKARDFSGAVFEFEEIQKQFSSYKKEYAMADQLEKGKTMLQLLMQNQIVFSEFADYIKGNIDKRSMHRGYLTSVRYGMQIIKKAQLECRDGMYQLRKELQQGMDAARRAGPPQLMRDAALEHNVRLTMVKVEETKKKQRGKLPNLPADFKLRPTATYTLGWLRAKGVISRVGVDRGAKHVSVPEKVWKYLRFCFSYEDGGNWKVIIQQAVRGRPKNANTIREFHLSYTLLQGLKTAGKTSKIEVADGFVTINGFSLLQLLARISSGGM